MIRISPTTGERRSTCPALSIYPDVSPRPELLRRVERLKARKLLRRFLSGRLRRASRDRSVRSIVEASEGANSSVCIHQIFRNEVAFPARLHSVGSRAINDYLTPRTTTIPAGPRGLNAEKFRAEARAMNILYRSLHYFRNA